MVGLGRSSGALVKDLFVTVAPFAEKHGVELTLDAPETSWSCFTDPRKVHPVAHAAVAPQRAGRGDGAHAGGLGHLRQRHAAGGAAAALGGRLGRRIGGRQGGHGYSLGCFVCSCELG